MKSNRSQTTDSRAFGWAAAATHPSPRTTPIGLAAFLAQGGDLGGFRYLEALAEAILVERRRQPPAERRFLAQWCRERVAAWVCGSRSWDDRLGLPADPHFVTALLWQAECLEDPALSRRFEQRLPARLRRKRSARHQPVSVAPPRRGTCGNAAQKVTSPSPSGRTHGTIGPAPS